MALRVRTIEYAFPFATASVNGGTARDFTSITVAIPEATSRTFRSVVLEVSGVGGAIASITAVLMGISIGAVARNDATVTQTLTNSGEDQSFIFTRDVTSYFQTNYSGTSNTVGARLTVTGLTTINCTAKLIITYEYDDNQSTRIKTVKIPIDGNTGNLTTTLTAVGGVTNQIPALDTFLPEANKVYRDIFFETYTHNQPNATNDRALNMRFNGTTTLASGNYEGGGITDYWIKRIDKIITGQTGAINTSIANTVEASTSNVSMLFPCLCGVLTVTYEYNEDNTTTVLQSVMIPAIDEVGWSGGPTATDENRIRRTILVPEPGTITLVQSGVLASYIDGDAVSMTFNIGSQTDRTFVHPTAAGGALRAGGLHHSRRFDSGAVGGVGMTLNRGFNNITIDFFTSGTVSGTIGSNLTGVIYLNYTSSKCNLGTCAQSKTTQWINHPYSTGGLVERYKYTGSTTPIIPETNWYAEAIGYEGKILLSGTTISSLSFVLQTQIQSGEQLGVGWRELYTSLYSSDAVIGPLLLWTRARDNYKRYPNDQDANRLNPITARDYRFDTSQTTSVVWQSIKMVTYHAITFNVDGTISGSDGGTISISLVRTDTNEVVDSITRVGNGTYSFSWYDNTVEVFVIAYENDSKKGITPHNLAGTADVFDINLNPSTGGGGEYAYGFA